MVLSYGKTTMHRTLEDVLVTLFQFIISNIDRLVWYTIVVIVTRILVYNLQGVATGPATFMWLVWIIAINVGSKLAK